MGCRHAGTEETLNGRLIPDFMHFNQGSPTWFARPPGSSKGPQEGPAKLCKKKILIDVISVFKYATRV